MAISKEILEETEFAKNHLLQSNLDDKCKKSLLRLINISTLATNGISLEEKVQKVTEAICGMVLSQITFLDSVDKKIENANKEQCNSCKAMKLALDVEEQKKQEEIINAWKEANGYKEPKDNSNVESSSMTIVGVVKTILVKPWAWLFGSLLVFSPYGVQIVNALLDFFSKQ